VKMVTPQDAARILYEGATLVDVRGPDEQPANASPAPATRRCPGRRKRSWRCTRTIRSVPLPQRRPHPGPRTPGNAARLAKAGACEAYMVWKAGWS
jgi:hypothetical protein